MDYVVTIIAMLILGGMVGWELPRWPSRRRAADDGGAHGTPTCGCGHGVEFHEPHEPQACKGVIAVGRRASRGHRTCTCQRYTAAGPQVVDTEDALS